MRTWRHPSMRPSRRTSGRSTRTRSRSRTRTRSSSRPSKATPRQPPSRTPSLTSNPGPAAWPRAAGRPTHARLEELVAIAGKVPARPDGVELIGEMEGSGYRTPPSLVRRHDGQTVQLTPLLYAVLEAVDGRRGYAEIAEHV